MVPRNLTEQQQDTRLSAVFDIQMHYGDAAASLFTLFQTLWLLFITKSKIGSERTPFWVSRRHPEFCNTGLKWHTTKWFPGILHTMATPLEKMCAGTRDVLWRWPHCSWWINKIKIFWNQSHYFIVRTCMCEVGFAVLLTSWSWPDSELLHVELRCAVQPSTLFTWPSTNQLLSIS